MPASQTETHISSVIATFADESAWAVYRDHPEHLRIIAEQIRPVLARRSAVQTAH